MPEYTPVSSFVQATGWTNTNSITYLNSSDGSFISDGRPGEVLILKANSLPFQSNTGQAVDVYIGARTSGTVNRQKSLEVQFVPASGTGETDTSSPLIASFPLSQFNFSVRFPNAVYLQNQDFYNEATYHLDIVEGGGMPDSATVDLDWFMPVASYIIGVTILERTATDEFDTTDENYFLRFAVRQIGDDVVLINDEGVEIQAIRNVTLTQNLASLTDEKISEVLRNRTATDLIDIYDDYSFIWDQSVIIYTRTGESLIDVTDQIAYGKVLNRDVVDSNIVYDQNIYSVFRNFLATDSAAIADTILSAVSRVRSSDDSAAINDEIRSFSNRARNLISSFDVNDQSLASSIRSNLTGDEILANDQISIFSLRARQATSNALISDEATSALSNTRLLVDVIDVLDATSAFRVVGKTQTEVLSLEDALIRYAIRNKRADDAITLIDSFIFEVIESGQFYVKTSDDSFSLFDQNLRQVFSFRFSDEQIEVLDAASVFASRFKSADDVLLVLDAIASTAHRNRIQTEAINVQDVFSFNAIRQKLAEDLTDVTDQKFALRLVNRALEDAITNVIDQFNFSIQGVVITETSDDAITIKDENSFVFSANRATTDNVFTIDQILSHAKYERLSLDLTSITDKLDKRLDFYRATDEQIQVLDSVVWILNRIKILSDEFSVNDEQLSFRIRGRDALDILSVYDENIYKILGDLRFGVRIRIGVADEIGSVGVDTVAILTAIARIADLSTDSVAMIGTSSPNIHLGVMH